MTVSEIRIPLGTILVWVAFILGLAWTALSAFNMYENGGNPSGTDLLLKIFFGLFLTISLTVIAAALTSLVERSKA